MTDMENHPQLQEIPMLNPFEDSPLLQPSNIIPMVIETGPPGGTGL